MPTWRTKATLVALILIQILLSGSAGDASVTPAGTTFFATEGKSSTPVAATFISQDSNPVASDYTAIINWGDGTTPTAGTITSGGAGHFSVSGTHTYAEEGKFAPSVQIQDSVDSTTNFAFSTANVADAALTQPVGGPPQLFSGAGPSGATNAMSDFAAAIGGVNNGTAPGPRSGGFRSINWDGVKLDGTDFAGDTTLIFSNTVGIPVNRFQNSGAGLGAVYAVSGNGLTGVNPSVSGEFPAFSTPNIFAPFNNNAVDVNFVIPSGAATTPPATIPVPAGVSGFGAIFLNVELANKSSIEYFNGSTSLGKFFVPVGSFGQAEFLGVLFKNPVVTRVRLTLGTAPIFNFDGTSSTAGQSDDPGAGVNLVAADNFVFSEPALTTVKPTAGSTFTGAVITFVDADPNANTHDYTALINWGDGHNSKGTITAVTGGFNVSGSNIYAHNGYNSISITVFHFGGSNFIFNSAAQVVAATGTALASSVNPSNSGQSVTFTATVSTVVSNQGVPVGTVTFKDGTTTLGTVALNSSAKASFSTSSLAVGQHSITASFNGSANYLSSTASTLTQTVI
jgi:hypothetical protein